MKRDLHIHTKFSVDGTRSVEEILKLAEESGLNEIAITDHNTALAPLVISHIKKSSYFSGKVISGIEIDVCANGVTFELLCYNFDILPVFVWAEKKFGTPQWRQTIIKEKLLKLCESVGVKVSNKIKWEAEHNYAHDYIFNCIKPFKENEKFLKEINNSSDFYRHSTTNKNFPLYLDMSFLWASVEEVLTIIHSNNGKVFLAHPYNYKSDINVDNLITHCIESGVDGIEVYHPSANPLQIQKLEEICKKYNLLKSGGSDFHGKENSCSLAKIENINM